MISFLKSIWEKIVLNFNKNNSHSQKINVKNSKGNVVAKNIINQNVPKKR